MGYAYERNWLSGIEKSTAIVAVGLAVVIAGTAFFYRKLFI